VGPTAFGVARARKKAREEMGCGALSHPCRKKARNGWGIRLSELGFSSAFENQITLQRARMDHAVNPECYWRKVFVDRLIIEKPSTPQLQYRFGHGGSTGFGNGVNLPVITDL